MATTSPGQFRRQESSRRKAVDLIVVADARRPASPNFPAPSIVLLNEAISDEGTPLH
jgi:hypothetical protein